MLERTEHLLADVGAWQFAYKKGYQVIDISLLINLMGQKCMEWRLQFVVGITDIPKCFDEVHHGILLETL